MDLVILGILNAVLLVLLLVAFKLIRSNGSSRSEDRGVASAFSSDPVGATADRTLAGAAPADDDVIDLRDAASAEPTMPVYGDPVFADDGSPLPEGAFEAPRRVEPACAPQPIAAPVPPPIGSAGSLTGLSRSAIVVDSSMNGSGPTPSELLFSVIETLGSIGFELTSDSPDYGLLKDVDGNTASIDLTKRPNGTDRIAIAVDSPRAVEALAMLEIWHRSRLGSSDQVRLSARIR